MTTPTPLLVVSEVIGLPRFSSFFIILVWGFPITYKPSMVGYPHFSTARPLANDLEGIAAALGTGHFSDLHFVGLWVATRTWRWRLVATHPGDFQGVGKTEPIPRKKDGKNMETTSDWPHLPNHWRLCQSCCRWSQCNSGCHLPHCNPRAKHPHLVQPLSQQPQARVRSLDNVLVLLKKNRGIHFSGCLMFDVIRLKYVEICWDPYGSLWVPYNSDSSTATPDVADAFAAETLWRISVRCWCRWCNP